MKHSRIVLLAALCSLVPSIGQATLNDLRPPGDPSRATRTSTEVMKAHADDSSGLRQGTFGKIDGDKGVLNVHGHKVSFERARVKVFDRAGHEMDAATIAPGAHVRFTLDPSDPAHRRPAVLYVD